jgi:excisionase family DNA binding protein
MLTTKEAAERLQVSEASIRVWLNDEEEKARRFPNAVKFGRDWQIPEKDVSKLPSGVKRGRPAKKASGQDGKVNVKKKGSKK